MTITRRRLLKGTAGAAALAALPGCGDPTPSLPQGGPGFVAGEPLPWRNWAGTAWCQPSERLAPTSEHEVAQALLQAGEGGVRPVGAGHSFSSLVPTDGALLSLDALTGLGETNDTERTSWVWAGTRLGQLGPMLEARNQAMPNLPDIDYQALGGALATSTHGTGVRHGSISSIVDALVLATPAGELLECDATHNAEVFQAARCSLGSLGVVTQARLRNRTPFRAREEVAFVPLEELLSEATERSQRIQFWEFYAIPHSSVGMEIRTEETEAAPTAALPEDSSALAAMREFAVRLIQLGRPGTAILDSILADQPSSEKIDRSYRVLAHTRNDRFHEMEYTVPAEAGVACLREILETIRSEEIPVIFPIEFRYVAADDVWLSMFESRAGASISIHQFHDLEYRPYFERIEKIFWKYEGRPHWGKLHTLDADRLAERYPRWRDFQDVRRRLDPRGRMLNAHLRSVFGA
jgi:FAD-linked oxidoreductase